MKWGLNLSLKYLTPSAAFRGCGSRSFLCISASPTSLFFSVAPGFSASSTLRSNQSSINSTFLNQDVDPSEKWCHLCRDPSSCCPLIGRLCAICSNQNSACLSSLTLLKISIPTHAGSCARQDPLLCNSTTRSATTLWFLWLSICSFCVDRT